MIDDSNYNLMRQRIISTEKSEKCIISTDILYNMIFM